MTPIAVLGEHFWREAKREWTAERATLSNVPVAALARYDWPGRVRELHG